MGIHLTKKKKGRRRRKREKKKANKIKVKRSKCNAPRGMGYGVELGVGVELFCLPPKLPLAPTQSGRQQDVPAIDCQGNTCSDNLTLKSPCGQAENDK